MISEAPGWRECRRREHGRMRAAEHLSWRPGQWRAGWRGSRSQATWGQGGRPRAAGRGTAEARAGLQLKARWQRESPSLAGPSPPGPAQPKQQDAPRARLHRRSLQDQQDRRDNSAGQQWSCADLPPPCLRGSQLHCSDGRCGPGPSATHTAPRAKGTVQTGGHTGKRGGHSLGVPPPPALTPGRQTACSAAVSSPGTGERQNAYPDRGADVGTPTGRVLASRPMEPRVGADRGASWGAGGT